MYKEFIIIIFIIVLIVLLDILTNNYTKKTVEIMTDELTILRNSIIDQKKEESIEGMEKVKEKWNKRHDVLAYYIEHDELEKVDTELTGLSADLDIEEYEHCVSQIDKIKFILNHIQEKEKFSMQSIF